MLVFFQHQHPGAARNHEAVAIGVIAAAGLFRRVVEVRAHRAHGVEQVAERPVQVLVPAGKDDVLLAHHDLLHAIADAMLGGRAGRGDRIVDALDAEGRRQRRRRRRAHGLGHRQRPDALGAGVFAGNIGRLDDGAGGGPARPHDDARHRVGNVALLEPGIGNGLLHGEVVPGRALAHEAGDAAVQHFERIQDRIALDLAAEAQFGIVGGGNDARLGGAQACRHLIERIADRGNDTHAGDDNSSHPVLAPCSSCTGALATTPLYGSDRTGLWPVRHWPSVPSSACR